MSIDYYLPGERKASDRRAHPRTTVRNQLSYDYYSPEGVKLGSGLAFTLNISQSGMLLETDKPLEPAAGLLLEMVTPLYTFIANAVAVYSFQIEEHRFRIGLSLQKVIEGGWQPIADMPAVEERE